jgi:hypothetical protein
MTQGACNFPLADDLWCGSPTSTRREAYCLFHAGISRIQRRTQICDEVEKAAENLHRADLTVLERGEQYAEWIELADKPAKKSDDVILSQPAKELKSDANPKGAGRKESGVSKADRELGIDKDDAHRAVKVASISVEAKEAARELGLDDVSAPVTITDLVPGVCRWPIGDPLTTDFRFCGAPSPAGRPYCAGCAKLAYEPVGRAA